MAGIGAEGLSPTVPGAPTAQVHSSIALNESEPFSPFGIRPPANQLPVHPDAAYDNDALDDSMQMHDVGADDFMLFPPFTTSQTATPVGGIGDAPPRFAYFIEHVEPPFITPFDTDNWIRFQRYAITLAQNSPVTAAAISCVEALYEAETNHQDTTRAMSLYHTAKAQHTTMLESEMQNLEPTLAVTFLLCCFEIVAQQETVSISMKAEGAFVEFLKNWVSCRPWPPIACRIEAWLKILHVKALHLGGRGLLSVKVNQLLCTAETGPVPSLLHLDPSPSPKDILYDCLSGQIFEYYMQIQEIGKQLCGLNRHHRSRGSPSDEVEVDHTAMQVKRNLYSIWQQRPSSMRLSEEELENLFDLDMALKLALLIDLCNAAYFNELVDLGRAHGQGSWRNPMPEALEGIKEVRRVVDKNVQRNAGRVNHGFMWPIFFIPLDAPDEECGEWSLGLLRRIQKPICRSDFAADLLEGVLEEQKRKKERVDCRYLSFQNFGIPALFI